MEGTKIIQLSKRGSVRVAKTRLGKTVDVKSAGGTWVTMASELNGDSMQLWFEHYSGEEYKGVNNE